MNNLKIGHFPPSKRLGLIGHALIILALAGATHQFTSGAAWNNQPPHSES
ncbi:MAG TPA: hypothetical protein PKE62_05745 [Anaerolineales bacterium]|nr:hypothetical protein [Anaerolineales bacterium]